jgi:hypothetical protein
MNTPHQTLEVFRLKYPDKCNGFNVRIFEAEKQRVIRTLERRLSGIKGDDFEHDTRIEEILNQITHLSDKIYIINCDPVDLNQSGFVNYCSADKFDFISLEWRANDLMKNWISKHGHLLNNSIFNNP